MNLPKVCHIIHEDAAGGGPVVLIDHLASTEGQVELSVIHGGRGKIAEYCEKAGIKHWQVTLDQLPKVLFGFPGLVRAIREASPDIVILHGQWAGPIGALALRLAGVRHSIYSAGWPAFYSDWDLWRVVRNRLAEAIPCRVCDRVVVLCRGSWYQYSIRRLGIGKLRMIHNGVDTSHVPSAERVSTLRKVEGWDDRHCHVVSVGRLADQKCVDWLLRSWKMVQDKEAGARLWIVGSGEEEEALRRLAQELKIVDTCKFLGSRPMGIEYAGAGDIVAMTTLYESHGIVALEGMACGRPVVVSDVDGPHDSVQDGVEGYLVPPANIEQFAQRLLELIRDPALRQRMGEAGRLRAAEFSVEKMSGKYLELVREVLGEKEG